MQIAGIPIQSRAFLAPMSGVTDIVMRRIAGRFRAGVVVSEMVASDEFVRGSEEARIRAEGQGVSPHVVQLAGCDPHWLGEAARLACTARLCSRAATGPISSTSIWAARPRR